VRPVGSWLVATGAKATKSATVANRIIRNPRPDDGPAGVAGVAMLVEGGVTRGVAVAPSTPPVGDGLASSVG